MRNIPTNSPREEIEIAESIVKRVLKLFDLTGSIEIRRREEGTILDIQGCANAGRLIGEEGATLHALQTLVTLIVCRKIQQPTDLIIDVNGYRERRREQLEDMAWRAFDRVMRTGQSITLRPMNSADRRVIHMTLSREPDIETLSVDEDPETGMKCVQIALREEGDYDEEQYPENDEEAFDDEIIEDELSENGDYQDEDEEGNR
jgi:spoIIIJ-associated protein